MLLIKWTERDKQFMQVDLFEEQSLIDTINDLSDKRLVVTPKKVINLVIKYLYAYRYPDSINQKISLREIEWV